MDFLKCDDQPHQEGSGMGVQGEKQCQCVLLNTALWNMAPAPGKHIKGVFDWFLKYSFCVSGFKSSYDKCHKHFYISYIQEIHSATKI